MLSNRPLALIIGLRYTGAKRRNHFISFISLASMLGIALGVAALITVMSVMNTIIQHAAPRSVQGRAAGSVTFFRSIGASVGTAITSLVLFLVAPAGSDAGAILSGGAGSDPATHAAWQSAFQATFVAIAAFIVIEWIMGLINPARQVE